MCPYFRFKFRVFDESDKNFTELWANSKIGSIKYYRSE